MMADDKKMTGEETKSQIDEFLEKVKELAFDLRVGVCPIWQCGGELEYIENRTNWQEPDLKCKNCGTVWLIQISRGGRNDGRDK